MWVLLLAPALACGPSAAACYTAATTALAAAPGDRALPLLDLRQACESGAVRACFLARETAKELEDADRSRLTTLCATDPRACLSVDDGDSTEQRQRTACDAGVARACRLLAVRLLDEGGAPDEALGLLDKACSKGSSLACQRLYLAYREGLWVVRDEERAEPYLRRSCATLRDVGCDGNRIGAPAGPQPELKVLDGGVVVTRRHEERDAMCTVAYMIDDTGRATVAALDCDALLLGSTLTQAKAARWEVPYGVEGPFYATTTHYFTD